MLLKDKQETDGERGNFIDIIQQDERRPVDQMDTELYPQIEVFSPEIDQKPTITKDMSEVRI